MAFITELWLPILVSAVAVFIVSSILHMVIRHHRNDYSMLPGEANVLATMRSEGVKPGYYMFPYAGTMKEMASPEMIEKMNQGPVGSVTIVQNGPYKMGKSLTQWFLFSMLISIFVAYIAHFTIGLGADYKVVFRITGTLAFLGYGIGYLQDSIWKGISWNITFRFVLDGLIYGLVTAGVFGWLWPA